jgi:hypothetical protein
MSRTALFRSTILGALLLAGACASPSIDGRFESFEERMAEISAQVEYHQRQAMGIKDEAQRETKLAQWQAVMQLIVSARAGGAIAYLNEDFRSLERIQEQVERTVSSCPEFAGNAPAPSSGD